MNRNRRAANSSHVSSQIGQAAIIIVVFMSLFLIGMMGLATDYSQIWAHRQMAQGAADAACQAGAADLFLQYQNPTAASAYNIDFSWIGSPYTCSTNTASSPCKYASLNGYSGSNVSVSFPSSVAGATSLSGFGTIANPYITVTITDPINLSFAKLLSSSSTVNSGATASCGLSPVAVPIPLVVLHQSASASLSVNGNPTISIIGGPNRAIQVDSSNAAAVNAGGSSSINLTLAGPNGTGADFGVFGNESQPSTVSTGTGKWISPATPYGDPWITVSEPSVPSAAGAVSLVAMGTDGCPDPSGCSEFSPGDYTNCLSSGKLKNGDDGCLIVPTPYQLPAATSYPNWSHSTVYPLDSTIKPNQAGNTNVFVAIVGGTSKSGSAPSWVVAVNTKTDGTCDAAAQLVDGTVTWCNVGSNKNSDTAIFKPGLYYVGSQGLQLNAKSTVRPANATGDGTKGTTFYFSTSTSFSVSANSGKTSACASATDTGCIVSFQRDGTALYGVTSPALQCPGGAANPTQVPSSIDGNVLIGPCSGSLGSSDGKNRGFLFFQKRSTATTASWGGGGQFLLSGFMYFHQTGSYGSSLSLSGNSGAGAFALGNVVADEITLGGTSGIKMILNPAVTFQILRPQLLK